MDCRTPGARLSTAISIGTQRVPNTSQPSIPSSFWAGGNTLFPGLATGTCHLAAVAVSRMVTAHDVVDLREHRRVDKKKRCVFVSGEAGAGEAIGVQGTSTEIPKGRSGSTQSSERPFGVRSSGSLDEYRILFYCLAVRSRRALPGRACRV